MKFAVTGEPCMDYIYRGRSNTKKQFGGILYSLVSLAVISGAKADVYPVMNLGEDEFDNVCSFLTGFPNIRQDYIFKTPHKTRVVNLYYKDSNSVLNTAGKNTYDREENSTEPTLPVEFEQFKSGLDIFDGILVNMVSGVDIRLNTLREIRKNFSGYIHMDLHNLVMQTFPDGTRKQLPLKDWNSWVNCCDTLQMNESELSVLTGDNVTEYETCGKILEQKKVKSIAVTRGTRGVSLYELKEKTRSGEKYCELDKTEAASVESPAFVDSTGCGDVFAAGFFYKNMEYRSAEPGKAMYFANRLASLSASLRGVEELHNLI